MKNDQELYDFHQTKVAALDPDLRARMVAHLRERFAQWPLEELAKLRGMIAVDPLRWWVEHHFFFGMGVRNTLRDAGFGEAQHPQLGNLDDYWVALVEEAAQPPAKV